MPIAFCGSKSTVTSDVCKTSWCHEFCCKMKDAGVNNINNVVDEGGYKIPKSGIGPNLAIPLEGGLYDYDVIIEVEVDIEKSIENIKELENMMIKFRPKNGVFILIGYTMEEFINKMRDEELSDDTSAIKEKIHIFTKDAGGNVEHTIFSKIFNRL